ncbi:MAG: hypothetical protein Tsb0021_16500 [Chlamydiales bacterium]
MGDRCISLAQSDFFMINRSLFIIFLFVFACFEKFQSEATEYRPWFGKDKVLDFKTEFTYRYYPHVDQAGTSRPFHSNDYLANFGLAISPSPEWNFQIEALTASSRTTPYSLDSTQYTGSFLFLNDVIGDPVSLAAGISVTQATTNGRKDISTFHSGQMNYEGFVSIGKETICRQFWTSRIWGLFGGGIANRGSPWIRGMIGYDHNYWDCSHIGILCEGLWGFGKKELNPFLPFRGYGSIKFRSIDLSLFAAWIVGIGEVKFAYTLRPWAYNFPTHAHAFTVLLTIPINPAQVWRRSL